MARWLVSSRTFSAVTITGATRLRTSTRMMTVAQRVVDISVPFQGFRLHRYVEPDPLVSTCPGRKSKPHNEKSPAGTWP
ncbi:hypothetical protein ACWGE0_19690, partial [Lentzea sp. NPDC054927]